MKSQLLQTMFVSTVLFSVVGMSGCSSSPEVKTTSDANPEWIKKPESAFPADRYLVAVGSGSDRESAIAEAKKSMAESFVVKVQSVTESKANSKFNQNTNGGASGEASEDVQKNVTLHTDT